MIDSRALVKRQRYTQAASAVLVLAGAIGLTAWYRDALSRSVSGKERDEPAVREGK